MVSMKVIVVYDIPVEYDKCRNELREYLKNFGGTFWQLSVYEVDVSARDLERMIRGIEVIAKRCNGRVEILFPCKSCHEKIRQVGVRLRELERKARSIF